MCNRKAMNIKAVSPLAPNFGFIPCGECAECRAVQRSAWTFRLRCELEALSKRGWQVAFCTLTFNDDCLPHIPSVFCLNSMRSKYRTMPMCFDKRLSMAWVEDLRHWFIRNYDCVRRKDRNTGVIVKDDSIRYMFCSEYGEHTRRCHHHFLLSFPPHVDGLKVFERIQQSWKYGYVFPKDFQGGKDSHNYVHKPFMVDSVISAAGYCSKYVCKDLTFFEQFERSHFKDEVIDRETGELLKLSDYLPFHLQSRSLGFSFLSELTDSQKLDYLNNGVSFVGDDKLRHLPVYFRNKLVFDNYYIVDSDGKRLCRRKANDFFNRHYREIYEKKVDYIEEKVKHWRKDVDFAKINKRIFNDYLKPLNVKFCGVSSRDMAKYFLSFGHCNTAVCVDVDPCDFWFLRYCACTNKDGEIEVPSDFTRDVPLISQEFLIDLADWFSICQTLENVHNVIPDRLAIKNERMRNFYVDLFKSSE